MNTRLRFSKLALSIASAFLITAASAAPVLRVSFIPKTSGDWVKPMEGFSGFIVPVDNEAQPREVLVRTYKDLTVSLSGQRVSVGGKLATLPARLACRYRSLSDEQMAYPFHPLLRSWVGSTQGFSFQVEGLRPKTKYKVTFYAYDYGSPELPRKGRNRIEDALNPSVKPIEMTWDSPAEDLTAKSPLTAKSASLVSTSSTDGRVLFIITPDIPGSTSLINGFEIEEVR